MLHRFEVEYFAGKAWSTCPNSRQNKVGVDNHREHVLTLMGPLCAVLCVSVSSGMYFHLRPECRLLCGLLYQFNSKWPCELFILHSNSLPSHKQPRLEWTCSHRSTVPIYDRVMTKQYFIIVARDYTQYLLNSVRTSLKRIHISSNHWLIYYCLPYKLYPINESSAYVAILCSQLYSVDNKLR